MSQSRLSPKLIVGIILALFFGVALYLRIVLPYDQVFSGDWIKFTGNDPYYFMRQVDNLVHNFPHLISFDPYRNYPHGSELGSRNLFVYLLSGIIWLVSLGSPTQHAIDIVGVYFPAIMGALTVIPVYFIGKELFNRWAGVLSAGLVAMLPGAFLGRSILGFTDRDAIQVLFTVLTMLFLILAIKTARQNQLTFNRLKRRDWAVITKPLIYSLLAGIFLGIYLLTWRGASIFVFIIFAYFVTQFIIDHLKHRSTDCLCFVGTITFFVALIIFWPASLSQVYLASLVIALLTPLALAGVSWLTVKKKIKPAYYPLTLIGVGMVGLAILHVISPSLLSSILGGFRSVFGLSAAKFPVLETEPILFPFGEFSLSVVWLNFTTGFFLSFVSLGILIYSTIKWGKTDKTLLIVWSLVILAFTLAMRRFALFFTVNVALLTGYFSWLILRLGGFREWTAKPAEIAAPKIARPKKKRGKDSFSIKYIKMALAVIVVFFLVFFPNIKPAVALTSHPLYAPSDAWCESLSWLKDNTPDPFGDPDFYYEFYETPFHYPETAYGVVAWWDYGYWITRIGRRLPNCDPGGGSRVQVSRFFTAQDEASAGKIIDKLNSRYIIIDYATATTKFYAMATYSGRSKEDFYDIYYLLQQGKVVQAGLLYPEYYRSLAVRLYNFDGREVTPRSSMVISYEEKVSRDGEPYNEITSLQSFATYEEAKAYISSQKSGNYRIVGDNPFMTPVPLKALENYRLIYSSESSVMDPGIGMIPEVKIFEYTQ